METLNQAWTIATVVLGLGFVIFIHELGHFLLAKWNGVKVLKFSIGFGPALLKYQYGETLYAVRALPLGGSVHMLGEGVDENEEKTDDPRAYSNKPVGGRMTIIAAGVLMNLLTGWLCFAYRFTQEREELDPRVGSVVAGSPAYGAGVLPGDEIVAVNGRRGASFEDMQRAVIFSGAGETVRLELRRPGREAPLVVDLKPTRAEGAEMPTIGVGNAHDLTLSERRPLLPEPGMDALPKGAGFHGGDKVVAIGPEGGTPEPVADFLDVNRLLAKGRKGPIEVVVERRSEAKGDAKAKPSAAATATATASERAVVTLPVHHFVEFGFRLEPGPIAAIRPDAPARKAGFEVGDRILKVDGRPFDPFRLPTEIYDRAGEEVEFEVARSDGGKDRTLTLRATPDATPPWVEPPARGEPQEVPGLGLAYSVRSRVAAVAEGSRVAKLGLKPGDTIRTLTLTLSEPYDEPGEKTFNFAESPTHWPFIFDLLQRLPEPKVFLAVNDSETPVRVDPKPAADWFHPSRGMNFRPIIRPVPPLAPLAALGRGAEHTLDTVKMVYATIRNLIQQRLGRRAVGGPIGIAKEAYRHANLGLASFLPFLGYLSVNLAVINFLPIFPLDGGQMLFLIFEKVRGRPLPERLHVPLMIAGLLFVVFLMLFATFNDIVALIWPTR